MSNNSELIMPMPLAGPVRPSQAPPRRTYGKKRILDPDLLDAPEMNARVKKTKTCANTDAKPQRVAAQVPLVNVPVNNPKPASRWIESSPGPAPSRFPSPVKPGRTTQDQNALDSPFLEPRKPRPVRRTLSTRIPSAPPAKPKPHAHSRHLSLHRSHSKPKKRAPDEKEELRRKTSEATVVMSTSGARSWLVPAPPRVLGARYVSTGEADFSFNPPAESTLAFRAGTPGGVRAGFKVGSPTPRAALPAVEAVDMRPRRKRQDSILSSDSEDSGTTLSVTRLLPAVGVPHINPNPKPKTSFRRMDLDGGDPNATPRLVRAPSLIEQFCQTGSKSRSGSVTVRPLNESFRQMELGDADDERGGEEKAKVPRSDASLRALADACASMGLDEPDHSSPSNHLSNLPDKRADNKPGSRKAARASSPLVTRVTRSARPYQLSPRTVYRLSQRPRVGMRIEDRPLSPNEDNDMFASYDFDRGAVKPGPSG